MNTRTVIALEIAIGLLSLTAAALLFGFGVLGVAEAITMVATTVIFIPLYYSVVQRRKSRLRPDERTNRIDSRAISWSWVLTASLLGVLFAVDRFTKVAFPANGVILYVLLFMISSRWIVYHLLSRKGDVAEW